MPFFISVCDIIYVDLAHTTDIFLWKNIFNVKFYFVISAIYYVGTRCQILDILKKFSVS